MTKRKSVDWNKIPKWIVPYLKKHKLYHKYATQIFLNIPYPKDRGSLQN